MRKIPRERLDETREMILAANDDRRIVRALREKYKVSTRQAQRYIALVQKRLAEELKGRDPDAVRAQIEAMLRNAYHLAARGSELYGADAKAMVQASKVLAELNGVLAPRKFEHSGRIETVDVDALAGKISQLAARPALVAGRADAAPSPPRLEPGGKGED
jgi:hypothetical protein